MLKYKIFFIVFYPLVFICGLFAGIERYVHNSVKYQIGKWPNYRKGMYDGFNEFMFYQKRVYNTIKNK